MQFFAVYNSKQGSEADAMSAEQRVEMGKFMEEMTQSGVLLATGALLPPSANGVRLSLSEGNFTITDGPFAEAKEVIAGFALLKVDSKEHLIEVCKGFLQIAGDGDAEIRQVMEAPDFPTEDAAPA